MSLLAAAAIAGGLSLAGSYLNSKTQQSISDKNVAAQQETNALNEQLTRESWARDDNAVQRRVADLTAAGLSPTLAAGSAAGNSSPIEMKSPEYTHSGNAPLQAIGPAIEMAGQVVGIEQMLANVQKTKAETITKLSEASESRDYYANRNWLLSGNFRNVLEQTRSRKLSNDIQKDMIEQYQALGDDGKYHFTDWSTMLKKAQFEYLKKQLDIFNDTGIDMRGSYGLGNILKLFAPDFGEAVNNYGGK